MERPGLASQRDLLVWAESVPSRTDLPRLVRRLILETGRGVIQLGFPAGEGASVGGWDGTVRATEATPFVPAGLSLWELSVEKSVGSKADSDYAKRDSTPDGSPTSDCTYVALSPRRWAKRVDWAGEHKKDGRWKDVLAYGLDDLETWLEDAPVTHAWISERLNLHPYGMRSAESWWSEWAAKTNPVTSTQLVLAGRTAEAERLTAIVDGPPQVTTIKGPSLEEIQAFVAAVGQEADLTGSSQMLARTALIDDPATWRVLVGRASPLVLVAVSDAVQTEVASGTAHHILVPVLGAVSADIELPLIDANAAAGALKAAGMTDDRRAETAGTLARRSLIAVRRHLATKPELHTPPWAEAPISRTMRGVLLGGRWSERRDGDRAVLAGLTGDDYEALAEKLTSLASPGDPFVAQVDASWALVSPYDAWLVLGPSLRDADLKRLENAVETVLGEVDPALELPASDRWKANLEGKIAIHSGDLREGLAETLALLGVLGHQIDLAGSETGTTWASYLVRRTLDAANEDKTGKTWASLSDVLPLLAEASPDRFLDAVSSGLGGTEPVLAKLFEEAPGNDILAAGSPHTGLLWALENIAWSADHFGQVADVLSRLDAIDPGGRLGNRPFASLTAMFCPWHPESSLDADRRLEVLDALRARHPETAWRLMMSMLPESHGVLLPIHEPRYRDWKPARAPVMTVEYIRAIEAVVNRALDEVGADPARWNDLLEKLTDLPPSDRARVRDALSARLDAGTVAAADLQVVWQSLQELISRHTEFSDTDWALHSDELDELRKLAGKLSPSSAYARTSWLFMEHMPHLGDPKRRDDHAGYEEDLQIARSSAIAEIDDEGGLDLALRLAEESSVSWTIGIALADGRTNKYEAELLPLLGDANRALADVAHSYFARRFVQGGWEWLDGLLTKHEDLTDDQHARLLLATRDFPKSWEVAKKRGSATQARYWALFVPHGLGHEFPHYALVAERLVDAGRHAAALDFMGLYREQATGSEDVAVKLVVRALDGLLETQSADPEIGLLSPWDYERVFEFLENHAELVGQDDLARLEWAYLPALGLHPDAPTLQGRMASDAAFFVQIVSTVFRPASGDEEESSSPEDQKLRERLATNAYHLLGSWRRSPGVDEAGSMDPAVLKGWVDDALRLLREQDRLEVGETQIGQALLRSPPDPDESWPGEAVRDLLEELQSERVESGLRIAVLNDRGVTSRAPGEGGRQEQALVKKYREGAERFRDRWPRTAALLRSLAESYENDARREEKRAERFRRGL